MSSMADSGENKIEENDKSEVVDAKNDDDIVENDVQGEAHKKKKKKKKKKKNDDAEAPTTESGQVIATKTTTAEVNEVADKLEQQTLNGDCGAEVIKGEDQATGDGAQKKKRKKKKKVSGKQQTVPPSIPISELYPDTCSYYPEGQVMDYPVVQDNRSAKDRFTSEEKRALDQANTYIYQEIRQAAEAPRQMDNECHKITKESNETLTFCPKTEGASAAPKKMGAHTHSKHQEESLASSEPWSSIGLEKISLGMKSLLDNRRELDTLMMNSKKSLDESMEHLHALEIESDDQSLSDQRVVDGSSMHPLQYPQRIQAVQITEDDHHIKERRPDGLSTGYQPSDAN